MLNERDERLDARLLAIELFLVMAVGDRYVRIARAEGAEAGLRAAQVDTVTWRAKLRATTLPAPSPELADLRGQLLAEEAARIGLRLVDAVAERLGLPASPTA